MTFVSLSSTITQVVTTRAQDGELTPLVQSCHLPRIRFTTCYLARHCLQCCQENSIVESYKNKPPKLTSNIFNLHSKLVRLSAGKTSVFVLVYFLFHGSRFLDWIWAETNLDRPLSSGEWEEANHRCWNIQFIIPHSKILPVPSLLKGIYWT